MLYRMSTALAGLVSVNSTYLPVPDRVTACRPVASPASVFRSRLVASTVPLVAASSASYSVNGTDAPRPGTDSADWAEASLSAGAGPCGASMTAPSTAAAAVAVAAAAASTPRGWTGVVRVEDPSSGMERIPFRAGVVRPERSAGWGNPHRPTGACW